MAAGAADEQVDAAVPEDWAGRGQGDAAEAADAAGAAAQGDGAAGGVAGVARIASARAAVASSPVRSAEAKSTAATRSSGTLGHHLSRPGMPAAKGLVMVARDGVHRRW